MDMLIAVVFSYGVFLVFFGVAYSIGRQERVDQIVKEYGGRPPLEEMELARPFSVRVIRPMLRGAAQVVTRWAPQRVVERVRRKLDLAGNPGNLAPVELLGICVFTAILTGVALGMLFMMLRSNPAMVPLYIIAGGILGFYLPLLWLGSKVKQRQEEIQLALPDALDLLTICVEAGQGFDAALGQLAEKWNNQLSRAVARALVEIRLGKARHDAMRDMAERADVTDLTNFIAAIIQSEKFGAGVAKILRVQSDQMRVLRRQRAQDRANQLPVKLLFPLVMFLFPSLFIVILGPAVLRMMNGLF